MMMMMMMVVVVVVMMMMMMIIIITIIIKIKIRRTTFKKAKILLKTRKGPRNYKLMNLTKKNHEKAN